ncbi:MAG: PQQ-dependent sugar dehydrogenase [Phycisphaeraceae bacterium]
MPVNRTILILIVFCLLFLSLVVAAATAQMDEPAPTALPADTAAASSDVTHKPRSVAPTPELIEQLRLPEGFTIRPFARSVGQARMLAVGEDGTVYVTCPKQGQVKALLDRDNDGKSDETRIMLYNLPGVHGIAIHDNRMYLAGSNSVWVVSLGGYGTAGEPKTLIDNLPDPGTPGLHPYRGLAIHDHRVYVSVGSTCNACDEKSREYAVILRTSLDGSQRENFAGGLRNTVGFDWHPLSGKMWGMDQGTEDRGGDGLPDELNRLEAGEIYGWPWLYAERRWDDEAPKPYLGNDTRQSFARNTTPSVMTYQPLSHPTGFLFYTGQMFPGRYQRGAFVAMHGSDTRPEAVGYKIVFLRFGLDGEPAAEFEEFLTGFLIADGKAQFGRPAGLVVDQQGALLFSDDEHGVVYRVTYKAPQ